MNKNLIFRISFLFIAATIFFSCSKEDESIVSSEQNIPFTGHYDFELTMIYSGQSSFDIDGQGAFNFSMPVRPESGSSFSAIIKGTVAKNGNVNATISNDTTQLGTLSGVIRSGIGNGYYFSAAGGGRWIAEYRY